MKTLATAGALVSLGLGAAALPIASKQTGPAPYPSRRPESTPNDLAVRVERLSSATSRGQSSFDGPWRWSVMPKTRPRAIASSPNLSCTASSASATSWPS